jgi:hypothetical protein
MYIICIYICIYESVAFSGIFNGEGGSENLLEYKSGGSAPTPPIVIIITNIVLF